MNRQQRRARAPLTRAQWAMQMNELHKRLPKELPDDMTIAQLLMDVIVQEQTRVSDESLAMLVGMASACMARAMQKLPPAKYADKNGRPVYSEQDVAAFTGQTVEQARSGLAAFAKEAGVPLTPTNDVQPLH